MFCRNSFSHKSFHYNNCKITVQLLHCNYNYNFDSTTNIVPVITIICIYLLLLIAKFSKLLNST